MAKQMKISSIFELAAIYMRLVFSITFLILLFGCKSPTKKVVDRYPSGQVMTEYIYVDKNDTSNYICKVYYKNGVLKHETNHFSKTENWKE
jgi:hypothetical protein